MSHDDFVNLHVHTMYSIQDSVIKIEDLTHKINEYGQDSCAITDHSSCAGWIEFSQKCKENNIKPIFGNEFYCNLSYEEKTRSRDHLVLLAMDHDGLVNIRRLQRISVENFYYKPILSYEILGDYTDGMYCTSACSLSTICKYILAEDYSTADDFAELMADLFYNRFALELQFHPDYKDQAKINDYLVNISDNYGIPLTISCDSHFIDESDRHIRKIIQAIAWHKNIEDINESLPSNCLGNSEIVKANALNSGFEHMDVIDKAIKQTHIIADQCNAMLEEPERRIPPFTKHQDLKKYMEAVEW